MTDQTVSIGGASAKVIEATSNGKTVLWTLQLRYQRFIHSEVMTHRVFSRNASSSRAIPVKKMLAQVWNDPAMPRHWGQNQAGMQASRELPGLRKAVAKAAWKTAGRLMCGIVWSLDKIGLHKQVANRLLEPWQYIHVIVTATEWDNFSRLRVHPDAQPEIYDLAMAIHLAQQNWAMAGKIRVATAGGVNSWHLPYITEEEKNTEYVLDLLKMSTARCARVSYLTHDGRIPNKADDLKLHDRLVGSKPEHASPAEHQAWFVPFSTDFYYNLQGWKSYRWMRDHALI